MTQNSLPPVLQRYELKYVIPPSLVEPITDFIQPYCELDAHSASAKQHFYPVNSLYFDTPGCEFLKQRMWGRDNRFNMRVRAYGDGTQAPFYLEIKNKRGVGMRKFRATATEQEWPNILSNPGFRLDDDQSDVERLNKELFLRLALSYAIEPKILTNYRRRAFFSTVDDYARLTMDVDLRYREATDFSLQPDRSMLNYDHEAMFTGNQQPDGGSVVLELNWVMGQVPLWMLDLIRHF
ncbi:MAG: polyphosphate polymerase domain-containing protein, partial [Oceanococcus sp.]